MVNITVRVLVAIANQTHANTSWLTVRGLLGHIASCIHVHGDARSLLTWCTVHAKATSATGLHTELLAIEVSAANIGVLVAFNGVEIAHLR